MSTLDRTISGYVIGDNLEITRTITDLPAAIETAWFTAKRHARAADADALVRKVITTEDVPGTGQIEAAGGVGVDGSLRFDLSADDTRAIGTRDAIYDIQIRLTDGVIYTPEIGTMTLTADVTQATEA